MMRAAVMKSYGAALSMRGEPPLGWKKRTGRTSASCWSSQGWSPSERV